MLRLVLEEGGFDYIEFDLEALSEAREDWKVVDMHSFVSGRKSQTMRDMVLQMLKSQGSSVLERLTGDENEMLEHMPKLRNVRELRAQGKHQEALDILKQMPESVQAHKVVLLQMIIISQMLEDASEVGSTYQKAIKRYEENFPRDPALDMLLIDSLLVDERYEDCRERLRRLDKRVGGDPFLAAYAGYIYLAEGNFAEVLRRGEEFREIEPDNDEGDMLILEAVLGLKDFERTAATLKRLEDDFDYVWELVGVEGFEEFLASPHGEPWR